MKPKILGLVFPKKNGLTWVVKCEKSNVRKWQEIYYIVRKLTSVERSSRNFQASSSNRKFWAIFGSPNI